MPELTFPRFLPLINVRLPSFGSRVFSNRTGLVLNNEMLDFSTPASQPGTSANYPGPGKMPLSAMSPVLVIGGDGGVELVTGSAGSRAIITTNAWVSPVPGTTEQPDLPRCESCANNGSRLRQKLTRQLISYSAYL